jgi:hypothetical protein
MILRLSLNNLETISTTVVLCKEHIIYDFELCSLMSITSTLITEVKGH